MATEHQRTYGQVESDIRGEHRREVNEALRMLMSQPWGRFVAWHVLYELANVMDGTYDRTNHGADNNYLAGRRDVGIELFNEIREAIPEEVRRMNNEWEARRAEREARLHEVLHARKAAGATQ